jgi:membrane-bound lytic murein transglycosylase D
MAANNLRNANIRAGDVLTIYLPKFTQKPPLGPGPKLPNVEGSPKNTPTGFVWYTVKSGDNLWSIARKYPGVTEQDIMRLNGMGDKLQPGMKIKVPTKKP